MGRADGSFLYVFENSVGMDYFVATVFNPLNNIDSQDSKFRRNGPYLQRLLNGEYISSNLHTICLCCEVS